MSLLKKAIFTLQDGNIIECYTIEEAIQIIEYIKFLNTKNNKPSTN